MAIALPFEIARMITDCVDDKKTFLKLLLTTHAFRLLAEPYLYTDVHFPVPSIGVNQLDEVPPKGDLHLSAMGHSFLQGITTGGDRCARYVKRLHLPDVVFIRREKYTLFQTILRLIPNLEDFQVHSQQWPIPSRGPSLNLQTLLEDPQLPTSPPPFVLHTFGWNTCRDLDDAGLKWFLSHQPSLERLLLPFLTISDSPLPIPTLPRLRVLRVDDLPDARQFLAGSHITHLGIYCDICKLDDATLHNIIICVASTLPWSDYSTLATRMPNLECLEIDPLAGPVRHILAQFGMSFNSATKLRYLRILPHHRPCELPWDFEDVISTFNSLPSLTHIIFQLAYVASFPEYYCFARGAPGPVQLRSKHSAPEWWRDDWVEDCVVVPIEPSDPRMGYTGDLLGAVG